MIVRAFQRSVSGAVVLAPCFLFASNTSPSTIGLIYINSGNMRRFFALAAAISALALGTSASQLPLGQPHSGTGMKDPSFPQSGVMDLAGANTVVGDAGRVANLADTLTLDRKAGLWWEYARDVSSVCQRFCLSEERGWVHRAKPKCVQ